MLHLILTSPTQRAQKRTYQPLRQRVYGELGYTHQLLCANVALARPVKRPEPLIQRLNLRLAPCTYTEAYSMKALVKN